MIDIRLQRIDSLSVVDTLLNGRWPAARGYSDCVERAVKEVIAAVRQRGDEALLQYSQEYDGYTLTQGGLRVSREMVETAYSMVTRAQLDALKHTKTRLETVSRAVLDRLSFVIEDNGVKIRHNYTPLASVGCYVPGREASYPRSLLMCAVPARVAGVQRVVVCTPPRPIEKLALTLVAADICGVEEIYLVGGAQAVAALAYGTETIPPVQKIVGPGNSYVTVAKIAVSRDILIDMPAGPSELMVIADETADPRLIALDMISQAEHSTDAVTVLVTESMRLAQSVRDEVGRILSAGVPREEIVRESLRRNGALYVFNSIDDCVAFADQFAPEHLEILTRDPESVHQRITSSGLVLIGEYAPVAASDYGLGVNHVLPTAGHGRVFSGLSVLDFVRLSNVVEVTETGLRDVADTICELAEAEGLRNHAFAVRGRSCK